MSAVVVLAHEDLMIFFVTLEEEMSHCPGDPIDCGELVGELAVDPRRLVRELALRALFLAARGS